MVSISRAAPDPSRMCKGAAMISGPMPSPCATVMGVVLDIGKPKHIGLRRVTQPRGDVGVLRAQASAPIPIRAQPVLRQGNPEQHEGPPSQAGLVVNDPRFPSRHGPGIRHLSVVWPVQPTACICQPNPAANIAFTSAAVSTRLKISNSSRSPLKKDVPPLAGPLAAAPPCAGPCRHPGYTDAVG